MSDPHILSADASVVDPAQAQHLDELIAELRDRGITPRPLNLLHFALEAGLSEEEAANLVALFERRSQAMLHD